VKHEAPSRTLRILSPLVDLHSSWIAVNPIQGCPKGCLYCFLNERGQTRVVPQEIATPEETVLAMLDSGHYRPERAVALYTWTDVMAVAASRRHLLRLLERLAATRLPNAVVLITKCAVPPEVVEAIAAARSGGLRVIVYLSYSGLGRDVERGVRHEQTVANFPLLAQAGIPVVHYWRPAFPESATEQIMSAVLDLAAAHARCSVVAGLKVEREAIPRLATLWPDLAATPDVELAEGVYPKAFWDYIHSTGQSHPDYPVFHTNSCALAYVTSEADRFGIFDTQTCLLRNHCPPAQRSICGAAGPRARRPTDRAARAALNRHGLESVGFELNRRARELRLDASLPNRVTAALAQELRIPVRANGQGDDSYWSSGTAGAAPLVIE
jgi:DNA repair photolyase